MTSVFKKLLSKELGEERYDGYYLCYRNLLSDKGYDGRKFGNQQVYKELYEYLKETDKSSLDKMLERLTDTMQSAVVINKQYMFAFIFYLMSAIFLILMELNPAITIVSLILMSACFIYKTCEYVVNKFCYIDASIALVYKSVLDKLILCRERGEG